MLQYGQGKGYLTIQPPNKSQLNHNQSVVVNLGHVPRNFWGGIASPKKMQPPARMMMVFTWPTILYVSDDVAPMTRNVDRLTTRPSAALNTIGFIQDDAT